MDSRDSYQFTPLHSAANGGHVTTVQKLVAFGHQVDVKDYLGEAPIIALLEFLCSQDSDTAAPL